MRTRAQLFRYAGLDVQGAVLQAHYELDGRRFDETVSFEEVGPFTTPAVIALAHLWYLIAGLSYYKAGAARRVDLGDTPVGARGRDLFAAALHDGLGEFSFRNDLPLDDVVVEGGSVASAHVAPTDRLRVLTPFGGGIDSVVTVSELHERMDQSLFVVSPSGGRFAPLEATAAATKLDVVRATRTLDPQLLAPGPDFFHGHVPVTAMITLLAAIAAVATGRGGVVMSNEYSSSVANLHWRGRDVNHQWSKSWTSEVLLGDAVGELLGPELVVASFLRDRSELWVASHFSQLTQFHRLFRSCNRAFRQNDRARLATWCGECDKCLFIALMLAPFVTRPALRAIMSSEPLANPALVPQLETLVGLGRRAKPFECVGDPDECAAALGEVSRRPEWSDVAHLGALARLAPATRDFRSLLDPHGPSRVPAHWLR